MIAEPLVGLSEPMSALHTMAGNPRRGDVAAVAASLSRFGQRKPIVANSDGEIIAGNHTFLAAEFLGWPEIAVVRVDDDSMTAKAFALADNRTADLGGYDDEALLALLDDLPDLDGTGYTADDVAALLDSVDMAAGPPPAGPGLAERFGIPPFSIFDVRQGYWQERKKAWHALGIASEEGRDSQLVYNVSYMVNSPNYVGIADPSDGTSVFDPVLCEIAYKWFCGKGGAVLDPFAGGSVRGIVAALLGRRYTGIDLSKAQVEANRSQWANITSADNMPAPAWHQGDSTTCLSDMPRPAGGYDLVFSCPPYADLEKYSDDPADISNMPYAEFLSAYTRIIEQSVAALADNRFAVWVVGEVRGPDGIYRGFVPDTIRAFQGAGAALYNEAVLITPLGTLPYRAARPFVSSRKLGKSHQNVLVFGKGDPALATQAAGVIDAADFADPEESAVTQT